MHCIYSVYNMSAFILILFTANLNLRLLCSKNNGAMVQIRSIQPFNKLATIYTPNTQLNE